MGLFVSILPRCFWGTGFFSSKPKIKEIKKERGRTHHHVVPWVPILLSSLPSFHYLESSHICFIPDVQGF